MEVNSNMLSRYCIDIANLIDKIKYVVHYIITKIFSIIYHWE